MSDLIPEGKLTFTRDDQFDNVVVLNDLHHEIGLIRGKEFQPDTTNFQISLGELKQIVRFIENE